jgi:hypothetical protein
LLTTYDGYNGLSQNRPGGGGGGGPTITLLARRGAPPAPALLPGGGGAASGGSIELTADGNLSVGAITANGGAGQMSGLAGGGGGGAGGLVMLRAGGTLTTTGTISVEGGPGGSATGRGGDGAGGRVRWDAQAGSPAVASTSTSTRTVHRGPSFMLAAQVFRTTTPSITVIGTSGDQFDVSVANENMVYTGDVLTIGMSGMAALTPLLHQGFNHLCLTIKGGKLGASEADTCVDVAFLP